MPSQLRVQPRLERAGSGLRTAPAPMLRSGLCHLALCPPLRAWPLQIPFLPHSLPGSLPQCIPSPLPSLTLPQIPCCECGKHAQLVLNEGSNFSDKGEQWSCVRKQMMQSALHFDVFNGGCGRPPAIHRSHLHRQGRELEQQLTMRISCSCSLTCAWCQAGQH